MWPSTTLSSSSAMHAVARPLDAGNAPGSSTALAGISNVPPTDARITRTAGYRREVLEKVYAALIEVRAQQTLNRGLARAIALEHGVKSSTWDAYWTTKGLTTRGIKAFVVGGDKAYREWASATNAKRTSQTFQEFLLEQEVDLNRLAPPNATVVGPPIASVANVDVPHVPVPRTHNGDIAALVLKAHPTWREQVQVNKTRPADRQISFTEHAIVSGLEQNTFATYFRCDESLTPKGVRMFVEGGEEAYREWKAQNVADRTSASFQAIVRRRGLDLTTLRLKPRAAALRRRWDGMSEVEQATFGTWRAFARHHGVSRFSARRYSPTHSLAVAPRTSASAASAPPRPAACSNAIANTTPGGETTPTTSCGTS